MTKVLKEEAIILDMNAGLGLRMAKLPSSLIMRQEDYKIIKCINDVNKLSTSLKQTYTVEISYYK